MNEQANINLFKCIYNIFVHNIYDTKQLINRGGLEGEIGEVVESFLLLVNEIKIKSK